MKIYLVGGAVRDQLLQLPVHERDWVVVGGTAAEMLQQGFMQVGKDFPVFLHPVTHEEYALARTERKTGKGYTQFQCFADPKVTLEEDLRRRDLTINAMAQTLDGELIDPYHGWEDLQHKVLRHVSLAFAEDPVRILRVARFAARLADFVVHPTTNQLMKDMLAAGEVAALVPERVWQEMQRALSEQAPYRFFEVLHDCGALQSLFPELAEHREALVKVLQGVGSEDTVTRFAAICYHVHPQAIQLFCNRYKIPRAYRDLALLVARLQTSFVAESPEEMVGVLEASDAFRRPERFQKFVTACALNNGATHKVKLWHLIHQETKQLSGAKLLGEKNISLALHQARVAKAKEVLKHTSL